MHRQIFSSSRQFLVVLILRVALAFCFLYATLLGYLHPFEWINYFPQILRSFLPDNVILNLFSLIELIIAGWLIWGNRIFIPSSIASFILLVGLLFNLNIFSEFYRNVALLAIAVSLAILSYPRVIRESDIQYGGGRKISS